MGDKFIEEEIDATIKNTHFDNITKLIELFQIFELRLDKAIDNQDTSDYMVQIIKGYVEKCTKPEENITQLTMLLGEEDLNIKLLESAQEAIDNRAKRDNIKLPSLIQSITEASQNRIETKSTRLLTATHQSLLDHHAKTSVEVPADKTSKILPIEPKRPR